MASLRTATTVPRPKVSMPRRPDRVVERPRLLSDLGSDAGWWAAGPDVLLACAPAGYGKTTMLADLADQQRAAGMPVAWVTCDRDDDRTTFWNAVVVALSTEAGSSAPTLAALAALDATAGAAASAFVSNLLAVVADETPGMVLVLDDVHEIVDKEVLDGIRHLVEWSDGSLRVALGCRFEPPVGLHRLRLAGRLHEVRASGLAFTAEEASQFWSRHGVALPSDTQAALNALTEGWPAGLRLAAMSLEGGDDPAQFVAEFTGADRPVADYLANEVLVRLPEAVVEFLLGTCAPEEVSVDLAARLTGRADSAAVLDDLASRNALVMPLDHSGTWFRYHSLLRTYLLAALRRRDPRALTRLQGLTARWFLDEDQPAVALEYASAAGDLALVERILREKGLGLLLAGAGAVVRRSIDLIPSRDHGPALLVHRALLAVDEGHLADADEALAALAALPDDGGDARMTSLRRAAALHRDRLAANLAGARTSELITGPGAAHLPADLDPDLRLLVLADRGALRLFEGSYEAAREDLRRAADLARAADLPSIELYCKNLIAGTLVAQNDSAGARVAAEKAIAFAAGRGWDRLPGLAYAYVLAGWTSFLVLKPEEAATWAGLALEVVDGTIDVEVEGFARTGQAIIAFDDPPQRRSALERLDKVTSWLTDRGGSPALTAIAAPHELRMCLGLGEWQQAEHAVARAEQRLGPVGDVAVLHAQLISAKGRPADARRMLRPVLAGELPPVRTTALTSAWLLEALLAERADRRPAATEALLAALRQAAPTGASRPFFDAGTEVHGLLTGLRGRAGHVEPFLDAVLTGIQDMQSWQTAALSADSQVVEAPLTAPPGGWLTERELVVLRDLPSMMTLSEVAAAQGISLNTVKTHVRSIYAKLDVGTRREAIGVGRRLGLL